MAKKKRIPSKGLSPVNPMGETPGQHAKAETGIATPSPVKKTPAKALAGLLGLPSELGSGDWTVILLSLMMFFAPALGVPHEEMLQDTLKSIVVAFLTLGAALILFWRQRNLRGAMRWHAIIWLPIMLMLYALGSMVWSHTYLGGVEAIRWFLFAVIVWLTVNSLNRERFSVLAWGIHLGALGAALWGVFQFWVDLRYIPQGPNPASTFVNRNFGAEFLVTTLAFSAYLLLTTRRFSTLVFLAISSAVNIVYILQCGTRSALVGMAATMVVFSVVAFVYRRQFAFGSWDSAKRITVIGLFLSCILGMGMIKTGNASIPPEGRGITAFERGFNRAKAIQLSDGSFGVRLVMWKATQRVIERRPLTGVGAGAWEVDIPLYQAEGAQLETDYYVHNEILQLLAEYGLVGWLFLLGLIAYLLKAAWRSVANRSADGIAEVALRATALTSLMALMIVSNIGFPWRLAATGAMFALCLGALAASDARLNVRGWLASSRIGWTPAFSQVGAVASMMALALAAFITQQAAECEQKIVRGVKIALTISQSGDVNNPKFDKPKAEMLKLIKEGTDINPHYRKITPMVADELARWGDWKNATWVWDSVLSSRPYVTAMITNSARGHIQMGEYKKAAELLDRAKKIQPKAGVVQSLEVILLSRDGREKEALSKARAFLQSGSTDPDLLNAGYVLGIRASDFDFAIRTMQARNAAQPTQNVDGLLKIAGIYASYLKNDAKALENYRAALAAGNNAANVRQQVPQPFQAQL